MSDETKPFSYLIKTLIMELITKAWYPDFKQRE